jgi:hypothetical protein
MNDQPKETSTAVTANETAAIKFLMENFGVSIKDWNELFFQYGVSASKIVEVLRQYTTS